MICPHCGKETLTITPDLRRRVRETYSQYTPKTRALLGAFFARILFNQSPASISMVMDKFLVRASSYPEDDIYFGVEYFIKNEYDLKGKGWEWCAGVIARHNRQRKQQEQSLPKLPKPPKE